MKDNDIMPLICLRCKKDIPLTLRTMKEISYTHYSYCEECLREGIKLLMTKDEDEELRTPFYVIDTPMGQIQEYKGKPMAFKKKIHAEWQLQETERLMKKNGFGGWNGYMFIRPITLEQCGKKKFDFTWMGNKTIGEIEAEEGDENE